jgi:hypothetical protein
MTTPSDLSELKTATILLSRQPLRPSLNDAWVRQSIMAVSWVKDNNLVLACSVGMQTWELVAALASMKGVPMRLYVPVADGDNTGAVFAAITRDFNLHDFLTDLRPFHSLDQNRQFQMAHRTVA